MCYKFGKMNTEQDNNPTWIEKVEELTENPPNVKDYFDANSDRFVLVSKNPKTELRKPIYSDTYLF